MQKAPDPSRMNLFGSYLIPPHIPDHCNFTHHPLFLFFGCDCVVVGFGYFRFVLFPRGLRSDANGTFCLGSDLGNDMPVDRLSTESCSISGRRRERRGDTKWILSLKECQCWPHNFFFLLLIPAHLEQRDQQSRDKLRTRSPHN